MDMMFECDSAFIIGPLAQWTEHWTSDSRVLGSIPASLVNLNFFLRLSVLFLSSFCFNFGALARSAFFW